MEVVNYSMLGAEERIVAQNNFRNRTEYLAMSLDSTSEDVRLQVEDTFCLPERAAFIKTVFDGYNEEGLPNVLVGVNINMANAKNWLRVSVPANIDFSFVESLSMRYMDGMVKIDIGCAEDVPAEKIAELTHRLEWNMERIGKHAEFHAQAAMNEYFSNEVTHKYLLDNDLETYEDGIIAEEEI